MSDDRQSIEAIRTQTEAIVASGILGRSRFYKALLEYLVACAGRSHTPKEMEIAAEVFNRGGGFDPSQDSMVRVYAHNLRQKLHQYYLEAGRDEVDRLTIPKGEYRIVLTPREVDADVNFAAARAEGPFGLGRTAGAALLVLLGVIAGFAAARFAAPADSGPDAVYRGVAASPYWVRMLDDDLPIVVVVGDYYIFGEADARGNVDRLVRDFAINSSRDLDELTRRSPELTERYIDLDLTYLPSSTASALREFLRVVYTTDKSVRVVAMSNLDAMDIRDNHVIYVGYLSALDKLFDFVFSASELAIGSTYDELVDTITGQSYQSEAGIPSEQRNYRDYGLVSVFPGPNGNEFMILAGTRDEGLMHSAHAVSDSAYIDSSLDALTKLSEETGQAAAGPPQAFEILYEVAGFGRANLDATIVHVAPLDAGVIWSGDLSL